MSQDNSTSLRVRLRRPRSPNLAAIESQGAKIWYPESSSHASSMGEGSVSGASSSDWSGMDEDTSDDDSDEEMDETPGDLSSRRRLRNGEIKAFFRYLDDRNISCCTLLRSLFDVGASRYSSGTRKLLQVHVKPFFKTHSAYDFVSRSAGARKVALQAVVDEVKREGQRAAKMPEIRRPSSMGRAEDIRTYRFADAMDDITRTMPFTKAVVTAIASSDDSPEEERSSTAFNAVAQASSDLPASTQQDSEEEGHTTPEDQMLEAWEDEESLEEESHQHGKHDDQPERSTIPQGRTVRPGKRSPNVIAAAATLSLLFGRNQRNSRFALSLGLFLFASRTPRRVIEVLSRLGLCVSYMTVLRVVKDLAKKAQMQARSVMLDNTKIHVFGYDNINWQQKVNNKGIGHTTSMQAATHGTIHEVDPSTQLQQGPKHPVCHPQVFKDLLGEDMPPPTAAKTSLIPSNVPDLWPTLRRQRDEMRKQALPAQLQPADVLLGEEDDEHITQAILSHVRTAFLERYTSIDFDAKDEPIPRPPQVWPQVQGKTKVIPLPVLDVDEGTTKGNLEVFKQYFRFHLSLPDSFWKENVLFTTADAYSVEKLKHGQKTRRLDRSTQEFDRFSAQQPLAAPWHLMYAYMRCLFTTYGGPKENASFISFRHLSERNGFRHLLSVPHNFHDGNRFLHFWFSAASVSIVAAALRKDRQPPTEEGEQEDRTEQAQRAKNLRPEEAIRPSKGLQDTDRPNDEFDDVDYKTFMRITEEVVREMLASGSAEILDDHEHRDDFALQSGLMLLDIALFIELQHSIKNGDPGRMMFVMKQLVPRFQAAGQHNYVAELLDILVTIRYGLPPPLRAVMLASFMANPKGKAKTFTPIDHIQENFVFELKHSWPVGGTTKSLQYKSVIGSLLEVFSNLKMGYWKDLGISGQNQDHSDKKRNATIDSLRVDFDRYAVFQWDEGGRKCDTFETLRGDAVKEKKDRLRRQGKPIGKVRQVKNTACDIFKTGMLMLEGKTMSTGTFQRWVRRRAAAMNKNGAVSVVGEDQQQGDNPDEDDDEAMDLGPRGRMVLSGNIDEFEELRDDNGV
ncbi:hypothetical protein A4X13_0g7535 [Tilletia indica]|uniref:DUF6589 domain-containing protein n=1 Tax=Tilletia indica TaxID=43049 RepID=A0A177T436_9BASI|nr:hypothetical protein A4X13_0g7535 [Tilletia indica]